MSGPPDSHAAAEKELRGKLARIESLLGEVDRFKDPAVREKTRQIVQALMDFHGAAVERLLERLADGAGGVERIHAIAEDDLVSSLLLLYGLHPLDFDQRVGRALEKVRPYLHSHGGNVELLDTINNVVRLRLQGSCHGCPSSAVTLKQRIEEAIYEKAPDVVSIEVEELNADGNGTSAGNGVNAAGRFALPILAGKSDER